MGRIHEVVIFTKANPKIAWQVDGKKYLFCCPPCVDEFVRMAKEEPETLKLPEEYVQGETGAGGNMERSEKMEVNASNPTSSTASLDPEIAEALAGLNAVDRPLADSQKYCAVATDSLLGSMGTPVKVQVKGETVFLCCDGCKTRALRNAETTLATVAKLRADNGPKRCG